MANLIDLDDFLNDPSLWGDERDDDGDAVEQDSIRAGAEVSMANRKLIFGEYVRVNGHKHGNYQGVHNGQHTVRVSHESVDPMGEVVIGCPSYTYRLTPDSRLEVSRNGSWEAIRHDL